MTAMDKKPTDGTATAADKPEKEKVVPSASYPAAGPHARPDLNDAWKTPGAGMLADPDQKETDAPGG